MRSFAKLCIAGGLIACSSTALAEFSGNVAITTDYVFRGISQTDEEPAIQGGFDYNHSSGFYAGVWGSNIDFNDGDEAQLELDFYTGFSGELPSEIGWDVGVLYYYYPGASSSLDYDYWELYAGLSYKFASLKYYYSPDFFGGTGDGNYVDLGLKFDLPMDFGIGVHAGYQTIRKGTDYADWKLGVTKALAGFDLELAYTDTNLSKSECGDTDLCGARAVFTVSKSF